MYQLEALTAPELQQLINDGVSTVVTPFGSIEHQGGHLPIGADAVLADAVGAEVAQRLGAVLAPTLRVGCSEQHVRLPGTLTLSTPTLTVVAAELAAGLVRQGFRVVVLLSTNGGNDAAMAAAVAQLGASPSPAVVCAPHGDVGPNAGSHSGVWLTSVMLALRPDLVRLEDADADLVTELAGADAERGRAHIQRFVASIVASVQQRV